MYKELTSYKFIHEYIETNFEDRKEYYFIGFSSVEAYITKIFYNYLSIYNSEIEFCCDFNLLQKLVKKVCSKEYFARTFKCSEKYIYSFIGAIICDNKISEVIENTINELYKIEEFLLTVYKKENNKYTYVTKWINKRKYNLTSNIYYNDVVNCTVSISEINSHFNNSGKTILETKYKCYEEIYNYIIDNRLNFDKDVIGEYTIYNAYDKLEQLANDRYINKPNYFYLEHNQYEDVKHEVRCSIEGYNFYAVKIHNTKEDARNLAAYSMLELIKTELD